MLTTKLFAAKAKSKKGFTLVEAMCSVFVLAIVFVGVLNAVAFSRQMVLTNNSREKASDKGQLIADEIFSEATGYAVTDPKTTLIDNITKIVNNNAGNDPQYAEIGEVKFVDTFTDASLIKDDSTKIECILTAVTDDKCDDGADGTVSIKEIVQPGWDIKIRVFYKEVKDSNNGYKCVDITGFAPSTSIPD